MKQPNEKVKLRLQEQFIKDLEIPIFFEFESYSYTDILEKLALRLTVYDHVKEIRIKKKDKIDE